MLFFKALLVNLLTSDTVAGSAQDGALSPHAVSKTKDVAAKVTAVVLLGVIFLPVGCKNLCLSRNILACNVPYKTFPQ